ncbi:hypothetical protein [Fictibacillus gelatini]|uniref:hypothetical protein n=1 Tax=Fictibacillus gelatini TaxID=225985 RepID=UPI00047A3AC4|nr:hypothetical protein [Fictibacillus gelatini]
MATYTRKYDFQPGTRISSQQVDDEFNQLIKAVNDLDKSVNLKADKDKAQMYKITKDDGGMPFMLGGTNGNIYGIDGNLATFYSNKDTRNNPNKENSFRGLYLTTGNDYGELIAFGNDGSTWRNTKMAGVWQGWVNVGGPQLQLWKGALYVFGDQTITPKKKLSECRNGWVLIWSDYDPGSKPTENDFDWAITFIPKFFKEIDNGGGFLIPIVYGMSDKTVSLTAKRIYINDSTITGHDDNSGSDNSANDVVLRYVYEF